MLEIGCDLSNITKLLKNDYDMTGVDIRQDYVNYTRKTLHVELPKDDPVKRRPDITKAKKDLAWEPVIPLEEGLKKTIEYFRKVLQNG